MGYFLQETLTVGVEGGQIGLNPLLHKLGSRLHPEMQGSVGVSMGGEVVWISAGEQANEATCHYWNALYSQQRLDAYNQDGGMQYDNLFSAASLRPRLLVMSERSEASIVATEPLNEDGLEVSEEKTPELSGWRALMHFKEPVVVEHGKIEEVEEGIRRLVEDCDSLRTFNLIVSESTTKEVLELLADEYPKQAKIVYTVGQEIPALCRLFELTNTLIPTRADPIEVACLLQGTCLPFLQEQVIADYRLAEPILSGLSLWNLKLTEISPSSTSWQLSSCYRADLSEGGYRLIANEATCVLDPKGRNLLADLQTTKLKDPELRESLSAMLDSLGE